MVKFVHAFLRPEIAALINAQVLDFKYQRGQFVRVLAAGAEFFLVENRDNILSNFLRVGR